MTDKQGFRIDNAENRAIESLAASGWAAESTSLGSTAQTVCRDAEIYVTDFPEESGRINIANAFDADLDSGILFKLANGAWTQATPESEEIVPIYVSTIDRHDHSHERLSTHPRDSSATLRLIPLMLANK